MAVGRDAPPEEDEVEPEAAEPDDEREAVELPEADELCEPVADTEDEIVRMRVELPLVVELLLTVEFEPMVEFPVATGRIAVVLPATTVALAPVAAAAEAADVMLLMAELTAAESVASATKRLWMSLGRPVNHVGVAPAANSDAISE